MLIDRALVEGVDDGHLHRTTSGRDLLSYCVELCPGAAGEEDLCPFPGEGPSHAAPDPATAPVDDGILALQNPAHVRLALALPFNHGTDLDRRPPVGHSLAIAIASSRPATSTSA